MNIANWLYQTAAVTPNAPALLRGEIRHADYGQFAARARALANCFQQTLGVGRGDRVALFMPNRVEYLEIMYAALWLGAVVVPVNHKLHPKEVMWILEDSGARLLCTDTGDFCAQHSITASCRDFGVDTPEYRVAVANGGAGDAPAEVNADHLAWLFYTSGTTGRPKGVMLTHGNLVAMSLCYTMDVDDIRADDVVCYAAPMSHGAGLYNFAQVRRGIRHLVPDSRGFDAGEILSLGQRLGSLSLFAAPTMIKRMVEHAETHQLDGTGLRSIIYGGGPMYQADIERALDVLGPRFIQIYGQGESPMTITALRREIINDRAHPQWRARLGSVGTAQSCVEVRVLDQDLHPCPPGQAGEIVVRGAAVMQGYWKNDKGTREALIDGWLHTGDIGYLSEDGFLTLTDRSKDVIISGGTNIYPREIEEVLATHPGVFEVAVVGAPNDEWGEEVVAFVVAKSGSDCSADLLDDWCKQHMAAFKRPRRYEFRSELPKNNYGKIPKTALREMLDTAG